MELSVKKIVRNERWVEDDHPSLSEIERRVDEIEPLYHRETVGLVNDARLLIRAVRQLWSLLKTSQDYRGAGIVGFVDPDILELLEDEEE